MCYLRIFLAAFHCGTVNLVIDTSGIAQEFHSKFYHPSNARVWFYGDDDPNQRLRVISGKLSASLDVPYALAFPSFGDSEES